MIIIIICNAKQVTNTVFYFVVECYNCNCTSSLFELLLLGSWFLWLATKSEQFQSSSLTNRQMSNLLKNITFKINLNYIHLSSGCQSITITCHKKIID